MDELCVYGKKDIIYGGHCKWQLVGCVLASNAAAAAAATVVVDHHHQSIAEARCLQLSN